MSNRFAVLSVTLAAVSPAVAADANPWRVGSQGAGQGAGQVQDVAPQGPPQALPQGQQPQGQPLAQYAPSRLTHVQPSQAQPSPAQSGQLGGASYAPMDNSIPRSSYRIDPLMVQVPPTAAQPYGWGGQGGYGQGYPGQGYPNMGYPSMGYPGPYTGYTPGFGGPGMGGLGLGGPGYGGMNGLNGLNGWNNNGPWSWMPFW
ncbi:hypothetical protein ACFL12_03615 [Pseudomonadota bacterium]